MPMAGMVGRRKTRCSPTIIYLQAALIAETSVVAVWQFDLLTRAFPPSLSCLCQLLSACRGWASQTPGARNAVSWFVKEVFWDAFLNSLWETAYCWDETENATYFGDFAHSGSFEGFWWLSLLSLPPAEERCSFESLSGPFTNHSTQNMQWLLYPGENAVTNCCKSLPYPVIVLTDICYMGHHSNC